MCSQYEDRYTFLRSPHYTTLHCTTHYTTPQSPQQQSCPRTTTSVALQHRRSSSSSTALDASPPCIVPGLVRGKIGRSGTSKSGSFSTWGVETCRCGLKPYEPAIFWKELFERSKRSLDEDGKRFFKLFQESTFEGSQAAARKMKKIAKRMTMYNQKFLLRHSLDFLVRSNLEMLSWPNSPILVMLQCVDHNVLIGNEELNASSLHVLAELADPFDYSTHENQLILAKQLIEHGANVNAVTRPRGTPLHDACSGCNVTNLDLVEYLLKEGADSNAQDHLGIIPLMYTTPEAAGAAKFLLNWPTTDVNITDGCGESFLSRVRDTVEILFDKIALSDTPYTVQNKFLFQQWLEIEY